MTLELTPTQTKEKLITGEELWAMGSAGDLYELIEGRIIYMSPTGFLHGQYEVGISEKLNRFVRQHKLGKVVSGEVGVYITRNPDTIRAADVAYISKERYAQHDKSKGYLTVAPELVVEILSPDDRWNDVTQKMREYFSIGVKLMWIADPQSRRVYAYRSPTEAREFKASDTLTADDVLPGFSVPVDELFEE
ncbi:MAG: Uma2 family endonuclease [Chloroflexi bacterium]|nr:Uma2 family endonuclease [Chloroflexota bacterium]MBI5350722.1 Uma2 family endonuclease [Chloroflexota bacterium]MBI5712506.1 Uma2 family endonuclease [Chloroflexota bacterium]